MNRLPRWLPIKPATLAFWRAGRKTPGYSWLDGLHGYIYGRWPYLYIGLGLGEHPLARRLKPVVVPLARVWSRLGRTARVLSASGADRQPANGSGPGIAATYHGKVVPLQAARQLVQVNEPIRAPDLEQVIPFRQARDLILLNPDHIVALECPCRSARANPCLPLDVCLIVGEPFASFVSDHHPERSRWISQQEAVAILEAENARGHVHHAFFKDAMLNRFYAICNCCSCCCGAMQSQRNGTPMLISSGYEAVVDENLCIACGECAGLCPFDAITMGDFAAEIDHAACMGCGVCVEHCVQSALTLERQPARGEPLEICELVPGAVRG
jgi:Pyruvate/2-oxoacid:ferredoxin oxidoreductase delta subunit